MRKFNEIGSNPNNVLRLVKKMKIESTDVVLEGSCEEMMEHITLMRRIEKTLESSYVKNN